MYIQIENLRAVLDDTDINSYQAGLARQELERLIDKIAEIEKEVKST